jgi:FlaA1/EpsC-like NDP-sugar epimerase
MNDLMHVQDPGSQEALLGRPARDLLSRADRRAFTGQGIVVTGAGGSIGSELSRQIAACHPRSLTLFEQSEYNLFHLERELRERFPDLTLNPVLGDVTRRRAVRLACAAAHADVVYHAAAYKHVTMTERAICPAVEVNVFGTLNVTRVARELGARLVFVSSDKAAQPRSVMGATKRLAELVVLIHGRPTFQPTIVRFGNVLGSSGSVVEIMLEQIRRRQPVTMTHPDATRYFMTSREAASLVMKADLLGTAHGIYCLDMGAPVKLSQLVQRLLAYAETLGLGPVPVRLCGLRPGEKLHEDLTQHGVELARTADRRVWLARQAPFDKAMVHRVLRALRDDIQHGDAISALSDLCAGVQEYEPSPEAWNAAAAGSMSTWAEAAPAVERIA